MTFERFLYTKYLMPNDRYSLTYIVNILAILGITAGVAILVIATAVIDGFRSEFERKLLGIDPHIFVIRQGSCFDICNEIKDDITKINNIKSTDVVIYSQALFKSNNGVANALIKGINLIKLELIPSCVIFNDNNNLKDFSNLEKLLKDNRSTPIILGSILAEKLNVRCGDIVYIMSPFNNKAQIPFSSVPFKIIALIKTGIYQYDEMLAYMNIDDAKNIFDPNNITNIVEIRVNVINDIKKTAREIRNKIGLTFSVMDWTQNNADLFLTLMIQKLVMSVVLFLIVLVAMLSASSALSMMVMSEIYEIAILKSMGALNSSIKKIFIFRGMTIGFIGNVSGILIGLFICNLITKYKFISLPGDVYSISNFPAEIDLNNILIIFSVTLIICLLFIFYPAHKASLLNPSDGIKWE